ncbi:MAG: amine dehydrogenase, partial [Gammaproteobacteria bacterium]|nr:amine dehydrogenase [Gammaproteobacteria bacterium]
QPEHIETLGLPARPGKHWVWINDISFDRPEAGRAALVDGDSGEYLGWLSTGVFFLALSIPSDYHAIYSVETYYSRGVRGERSDVVTAYDPRTLLPLGEIPIPPKRATGTPTLLHAGITDDDRFLLVYNFTPAQSVSVVDLKARRLVGEIATAGCVLVYPDGARRFHMLCGDGGVLLVELDEAGRATRALRHPGFFDPQGDPVQEDAIRIGYQWVHVSFDGHVYIVNASGGEPEFGPTWSLLSTQERAAGWRPGGLQLIAGHEASGRLFVLLHEGGAHSQEDPGTEVWVYDLDRKSRTQRIPLRVPATSIEVSRDEAPLLFAVSTDSTDLEVYDANTGAHLRTVEKIAVFPTLLQAPWRPR